MNILDQNIKSAVDIMRNNCQETKISINFSDGDLGIIGDLDDIPAYFTRRGELYAINLNGLILNRVAVVIMIGELAVNELEKKHLEDSTLEISNEKPFIGSVL